MSDINNLVNKIDSKRISNDEAINVYNDIAKKAKKNSGSRQTPNRQNFLEIIDSLEKIFNELPDTTDMVDLKSEESAAERRKQKGLGLKILTPNQVLSRLPISLAQLKAGNNSEKLKNEIRQLLYSLYRSKKQLYKSLIDII